jgi:hypothetical protein
MTRDNIIRMAREAGAFPELSETPDKDVEFLRKFAALVAAAEREACAVIAFNAKTYIEAAKAIRARGQR